MQQPNPPQFVTITGVDQRTSVERMVQLATRYPVEWGVLFSPKLARVQNRYVTVEQSDRFTGHGLRLAAHLCGGAARAALAYQGWGHPSTTEQQHQLVAGLVGFNRAQINYVPNPTALPDLRTDTGWPLGHFEAARFGQLTSRRVIVQHRTLTYPQSPGLDYLFDKSGGRGLAPASWPPHPGGGRLVGYAGGLGPHVLPGALAAMDTSGPYWLDMEGRVRTQDDWLDMDAVEQVLVALYGQGDTASRAPLVW